MKTSIDINVLIVEDNAMDARLITTALTRAGLRRPAMVVEDGVPALAILRRDQDYTEVPLPDLLILDLNLRLVDGPEVLAYIRQTPGLAAMCVAILSSSPTDVMMKKAVQANCYFTKPNDLQTFTEIGGELLNCYRSCDSTRFM